MKIGDVFIPDEKVQAALANKELNLNKRIIYSRIDSGWDEEEALTTPRKCTFSKYQHLAKEDIAEARKNNIPGDVFRTRVRRYHWDIERAKTEPVRRKKRKGDLG